MLDHLDFRKTCPDIRMERPSPWEVERRVTAAIAEHLDLPLAQVRPDARLIEDLGMDSLALVDLTIALEEEFDLTLPETGTRGVFTRETITVAELARCVYEECGTGTPDRSTWKGSRKPLPEAERVPFTQMGGRLTAGEWLAGPLYEPLGANREGVTQLRRRTDGMRCALIPEGKVWIGSEDAEAPAEQQPLHRVEMPTYLMDAEPVSVTAYARFLNSVGELPEGVLEEWCGVSPGDQRGRHFPLRRSRRGWEPVPGTEEQPAVLVSWFGANAYSLWANRKDWQFYRGDGERVPLPGEPGAAAPPPDAARMFSGLPSEAEWERAARGEDRRRFPWGDGPADGRAVTARHRAGGEYTPSALPAARVSTRLGMSPFGLHHMAGNVWNWCRDWYDPAFYRWGESRRPGPQHAHITGIRSERGGSWVGPVELAACCYRRGRSPGARGRCLGFRCVGDVLLYS